MKNKVWLSILVALSLAIIPAAASASSLIGGSNTCNSNTQGSAVCNDVSNTNNPIFGQNSLIIGIANVIAYIAGIIAIIILIVGSIKYITSNGDSNAVSSAKSTIIGALIGLAIIALAYTIIDFVVTRL